MPTKRIDQKTHDLISSELQSRRQQRDGDHVATSGYHTDHGRTALWQEAEMFLIVADDVSRVRGWSELS